MSANRQSIIAPSVTKKYAFYLLLAAVALLGLINLDRLPIAWNDEIQNLDPAFVWHHTHQFRSPLWPNPGAEFHFLSYPPLIEAWHCLWLFCGKSPWIIRLPFLLFHLLTILLLHRFLLTNVLKSISHPQRWALLLTAIFLFDKSTGEIARSLRVETLILLLFSLLIFTWNHAKNSLAPRNFAFLGLILGSLGIAHLYTWPLIAMALILAWFMITPNQSKSLLKRVLLLLGTLLPFALFWLSVQPNWSDLKSQLFMQAGDHQTGSIFQNIPAFFVGRFIPYSLEQPYTPLLHLTYFFIAIWLLRHHYQQHKSLNPFLQAAWIPCLFLAISLPMMLLLTPQHRYYPIQHFWGVLLIAEWLNTHVQRTKKQPLWLGFEKQTVKTWIVTLAFATFLLFPFTIRHTSALLQRPQRNPQTAIQFLNKNLNHLPEGEILGEPIANYWLAQSPHPEKWSFGFEFYPQHFPFNPQKPRYFLSRTSPQQLPFLKLVDQLHIPSYAAFKSLPLEKFGHTYDGLFLYQIESETAWKKLTHPAVLRVTSGH